MTSDKADPQEERSLTAHQEGGVVGSPHDRRSALTLWSSLFMAGGLFAGYGSFFAMAGRYLFPNSSGSDWLFVPMRREFLPVTQCLFSHRPV